MEKTLTGTGKMNKHPNLGIISFLISILMLVACNSSIKTNEEANIMSKSDKETIFSMIIEHADLQQYFHQEEPNRMPLRVKSNENLGVNLSIIKFGKPVKFYTHAKPNSDAPFFEVILFSIDGNNAIFNILYAIEGITVQGKLKKANSEWLFVEFEVFES